MNERIAAALQSLSTGEWAALAVTLPGVRAPDRLADDLGAVLGPLESGARAALAESVLVAPDPEAAARNLRRLQEVRGKTDADGLVGLVPLLAWSAEAVRFLVREPAEVDRLRASPYLYARRPLASMRDELGSLGDDPQAALRRFRHREHARIAWRDLTDAPMEELLGELSDVAEAVLDAAARHALAAASLELGPPLRAGGSPCGFCVLGLGKLGGGELNFSSDVDLLYVYETDEGSAGERTLHEHFSKVARAVNRLVGEATDDGFAFRIDLDLRPEGKKGPLVNSLPSLESYYESWGQTWERMALIQARPVGGDRAFGERVLAALAPFVYRRTLDPSAFEEIRMLKARIDQGEQRRGGAWNVKLGRGGIRELEFFAQAHQLLLGGKRERLRVRGTLRALRALEAERLLTPADQRALEGAYLFLRRLEHRLQIAQGRQLHRLPEDREERARLARALGLTRDGLARDMRRDAAALERALLRHRRTVMARFDALFPGGAAGEEVLPPALSALADVQPGEPAPPEAQAALRAYGLRDADAAYAHLGTLARAPGTPLDPRAPARVRAIMPLLLRGLCSAPDPDLALRHAAALLQRMQGRYGSYALLRENPATLRTLLDLFGTSDFLAKLVVQRPELLDPLIIGVVSPRRSREELAREIQARTAALDDESLLDEWRREKSEEILRIGLSDVAGTIDLLEVQTELTALAETLVGECLRWATRSVAERYGEPQDGGGAIPLCVVGMGKLGGAELNYNSDLDLLFVYANEGPCSRDPGRTSQEFFAKVAQKLLFGLSCVTSEGFLYHIDARLRPSGRHGSLVSSVQAFAQYHEASAQVWERLALTRARPVAGPAAFQERVAEVLARATYERPFPEGGAREVDRLRRRMEVELAREGPHRYNVKLGRGGLVDVEFATQLLQLRAGRTHPEVRSPGTLDALGRLRTAGAWDAGDLTLLREAYLFLRRLENRLRIHHDNAQSVLWRDAHALRVVARRMGFRGGGEALLAAYEETTGCVREIYQRVVGAMP